MSSPGLLTVQPESLRDPKQAVKYAELMVEMGHRQKVNFLIKLVEAYRMAGQREKARATAREALNLLPPGSYSSIRKQLMDEIAR